MYACHLTSLSIGQISVSVGPCTQMLKLLRIISARCLQIIQTRCCKCNKRLPGCAVG